MKLSFIEKLYLIDVLFPLLYLLGFYIIFSILRKIIRKSPFSFKRKYVKYKQQVGITFIIIGIFGVLLIGRPSLFSFGAIFIFVFSLYWFLTIKKNRLFNSRK